MAKIKFYELLFDIKFKLKKKNTKRVATYMKFPNIGFGNWQMLVVNLMQVIFLFDSFPIPMELPL